MDRSTRDVSVVIPVFNSQDVLAATVSDVVVELRGLEEDFEVVLVDDGSVDDSWSVASGLTCDLPEVRALRLLRNFGQHKANLAGLRAARGQHVVTMDDDGQNPADELGPMLAAAREGADVVFGDFALKRHGAVRRLGSSLITSVNRRVFDLPHDLAVSNFRVLDRAVVDRICASSTPYPYITGQALLYSAIRTNVTVEHRAREVGSSNYNLLRTLRLVATILFSYSVAPLHAVTLVGGLVAAASFLVGLITLIRGIVADVVVPGWTSLAVLVAFLQGVVLLLLSMLGEYVVRTMHQVGGRETYIIVTELS